MTILVVGATGATGSLLVQQLLHRGHHVKAIVRSPENLPESVTSHKNMSVIQASILDLSDAEMAGHVKECDAIVSCLGHNLSFKGMFGPPRRLVLDATQRLCRAIKANKPETLVKFVLMNTAGNRNRDLDERISPGQKFVLVLLRLFLPPHRDNEDAAEYLRKQIGQNDGTIEWAAVRPDTLIDEKDVSDYDVYASPIRSALFDPGTTSRINVAHFMATLVTDNSVWQRWKGQMPVIYNKASEAVDLSDPSAQESIKA